MVRLAACFAAACRAGVPAADEAALRAYVEAARASLPGLPIEAEALVRHLAERADERGLPAPEHAGDLLLALGCVRGLPEALATFELRYADVIERVLRKRGADALADDVAQSVRELGVLSIEEAVRLLTDAPARVYGLRERGHIAEGWHADLAIFDPARIGATEESVRHDLPGGSSRIYVEATGMRYVFVNGVEVVRNDSLTGNLGGKVLRSGKDAVRTYRSSEQVERTFCGTCGSRFTFRWSGLPDAVWVAVGLLGDDPALRPQHHMFVGSKAPWHEICDELPQYAEYPPFPEE